MGCNGDLSVNYPPTVSSQADTVTTSNEIERIANRFEAVASQFCSVIDSAPRLARNEFVSQVYRILPKLIDEAIGLPELELSDNDEPTREAVSQKVEWNQLYTSLKERLGDWDLYRQVFDPTKDAEAIYGSLADDIADIYRDLKEVLLLKDAHRQRTEESVWEWRFLFYSHWGKHAMEALLTIHFRLQHGAL